MTTPECAATRARVVQSRRPNPTRPVPPFHTIGHGADLGEGHVGDKAGVHECGALHRFDVRGAASPHGGNRGVLAMDGVHGDARDRRQLRKARQRRRSGVNQVPAREGKLVGIEQAEVLQRKKPTSVLRAQFGKHIAGHMHDGRKRKRRYRAAAHAEIGARSGQSVGHRAHAPHRRGHHPYPGNHNVHAVGAERAADAPVVFDGVRDGGNERSHFGPRGRDDEDTHCQQQYGEMRTCNNGKTHRRITAEAKLPAKWLSARPSGAAVEPATRELGRSIVPGCAVRRPSR